MNNEHENKVKQLISEADKIEIKKMKTSLNILLGNAGNVIIYLLMILAVCLTVWRFWF